jgi:pyruvate carboxylase
MNFCLEAYVDMKRFKRLLVANRGEIAIRIFRACHELGIRSVAIFSEEDRLSLFRSKADEAYPIGKGKGPVEAYLNIDEIIQLALKKGVDAIHPGYGFLSENPEFALKCHKAGIVFVGPDHKMMEDLGDKIQSKILAKRIGVPVIPGVEKPIRTEEEAIEFASACGYPVMLKASAGGGGRGMRIVRSEGELLREFRSARNEAKKSFGIEDIFLEKYLTDPKHIEVQILGDNFGNIVHLFERDCSIQRRHQKIVELAPAPSISEATRKAVCRDALRIAQAVKYRSAGTVEFLVDKEGKHYFIEMNPRIQVEHTVSEMITGIDIVQSQILIAQGLPLDSEEIGISGQDSISGRGYAIQCRITTEDPFNNFAPDTGKIDVYRTSSGFGIRLDGGNGFAGSVISPYYDSLLVKATSWSRTFEDARRKAMRCIRENRIEGVKTNAAFLLNLLDHPQFREGKCNTGFIENHPELFDFLPDQDMEKKVLEFIGEKIVTETRGSKPEFNVPKIPAVALSERTMDGPKNILDNRGAEAVKKWIKDQDRLLLTDTTMRDAHQSLMATRMRTRDMTRIAEATSVMASDLFSLEMWGGATFDVAYRFLHESPWERLDALRKKIPNIMFQMLIRGSNAVGYKNYPDNVIKAFVREAASGGIDIFRIFDSLNWLKGMEVAIEEVLASGKIAEACICYTGDILDKNRHKYSLDYYVKKAKEIERTGVHILGIKDMSGLLKPFAAYRLVKALKEEISLPIHLHTHDTSGNGVATVLMAARAGVDIADTAFNSMSGLTSQPALNSVVAALENTPRETGLELEKIQEISDYWDTVREVYAGFETGLKSGTAEIYKYEIPGGQYSNLKPQVESFGLGHKFTEVKEMFRTVNSMFGDIVKVTPSSKAVGDMAIFMVQNGLTPENILEKGKGLAFPDSVVSYFQGMMGQPEGGFDPELQEIVLKGEEAVTCRPGVLLEPEDFQAISDMLEKKHGRSFSDREVISYCMYPKVFEDYLGFLEEKGDFSRMGSDIFFHGLSEGETCEVEVEEGKSLMIRFVSMSRPDEDGNRVLDFEVDGHPREIVIHDPKSRTEKVKKDIQMADPENGKEIASNIPGTVSRIMVQEGDTIEAKQEIFIVEAMKMETSITASEGGTVAKILVGEGEQVKAGQLLLQIK